VPINAAHGASPENESKSSALLSPNGPVDDKTFKKNDKRNDKKNDKKRAGEFITSDQLRAELRKLDIPLEPPLINRQSWDEEILNPPSKLANIPPPPMKLDFTNDLTNTTKSDLKTRIKRVVRAMTEGHKDDSPQPPKEKRVHKEKKLHKPTSSKKTSRKKTIEIPTATVESAAAATPNAPSVAAPPSAPKASPGIDWARQMDEEIVAAGATAAGAAANANSAHAHANRPSIPNEQSIPYEQQEPSAPPEEEAPAVILDEGITVETRGEPELTTRTRTPDRQPLLRSPRSPTTPQNNQRTSYLKVHKPTRRTDVTWAKHVMRSGGSRPDASVPMPAATPSRAAATVVATPKASKKRAKKRILPKTPENAVALRRSKRLAPKVPRQ